MLQQGGSSPAMRATRSGSSSGWVKRRSEMRSAVTHANPKATGFTWQTLCIAWSVPPINQDGAFLQTPFVFPWILYIDPGLNLWRRTLGMHDACNVPERPGLRHRPMHHAMLCYSAVFQKVVNISYHYKCMINVLKRAIIGWYDSARNVSSVRSPYVPNINIMWLRLSKEKKTSCEYRLTQCSWWLVQKREEMTIYRQCRVGLKFRILGKYSYFISGMVVSFLVPSRKLCCTFFLVGIEWDAAMQSYWWPPRITGGHPSCPEAGGSSPIGCRCRMIKSLPRSHATSGCTQTHLKKSNFTVNCNFSW